MSSNLSFRSISVLHVLNDGFYAGLLLLLPFIAKDLHINLTQTGLLGTVINSLGIVCALPAGYLAARFGSMKVVIASALLYAIGYMGTAAAPSYPWLFPMFIIAGIGFGLFHPIAFALVTRVSAPAARGKNMGNFTAIGDIGKMGAPAILTFIVAYVGWRSSAIIYGLIALLGGIICLFLLRHYSEIVHRDVHQQASIKTHEVLKHPRFFLAMCTSFFDSFASGSLFMFLPFLLLKRGIDPALLGTFSAVFFLGSLFGKTALGIFSDRFSNAYVVIISELLMAIAVVCLASSSSIFIIMICAVIAGIFTKGTVPVIQTMLAEASEHHGHFEKSFAVNGFTNAIALAVSPVFLGFLSDQWGIVVAFYAMATIALFAIIPAFFFRVVTT